MAWSSRAKPSANPTVREQQLADINTATPDAFEEIDNAWYEATGSLYCMVAEYIIRNPEAFAKFRAQPWQPKPAPAKEGDADTPALD